MATYTVNTDRDDTEGDDTLLSLREAVARANVVTGADTITFATGVELVRLTQGTEIEITDTLAIEGGSGVTITGDAEGDDTTLEGTHITDLDATPDEAQDDNTRLFNVTAVVETTFRDLVLTGGRTVEEGEAGGALRNAFGSVTLVRSTVSGNETTGQFADGGGFYTRGDATLTNVTISGNATSGRNADGGGLSTSLNATLTDVTISGNATKGNVADGGGLFALGNATLTNVTVSGNATTGNVGAGGGLYVFGNATLTNVTISGNETFSGGGGLFAQGDVRLTNVTISGNETRGSFSDGGGLFAGRSATLTDSIVLGNASAVGDSEIRLSTGSIANPAATLTFESANIVGADPGAFDTRGFANVTNAAPAQVFAQVEGGAGVLADNGGPTETILIAVGGAAQDRGTGSAEVTDQRGETRPFGPGRDIGAVELQEAGSLIVTTEADGIREDGETTLREAVAFANLVDSAATITFADGVELIRLTEGTEIEITDALTIEGGAGVTITGDAEGDDTTLAGTAITDSDATIGSAQDDNTRLFNVTTGVDTIFRDLVLTGGRTVGDAEHGGALRSNGSVTLERSTLSGNETTGAFALGGGLFTNENATLTNVTVSGNATSGQSADGGGINASNVTLTNVTITGNATRGDSSQGGGLFAARTATLTDSIVLGNASVLDDSEIGLFGGNFSSDPAKLTFAGANIVGADAGAFDASGPNVTNAALSDVFAQVADGAGVLADNGGPTETILIAVGGAAQDRGTGSTQTTDQRGETRPFGPGRDIGAVELQEVASLTVTTEADGIREDGETTLREAVAFANLVGGAATITFADGVELIRLTEGTEIEITDTLTIEGGAGVTITGDAEADDTTLAGTDITDLDATADDAQGDNTRLFNVTEAVDTTFRDLVLTGGRTVADAAGGGALRSLGAVTLERSTISGNETVGDASFGGGLFASRRATLTNVTISGNETTGDNSDGGGIYASNANLTNVTISGNETTGESSSGGGIKTIGAYLKNVTISGNATRGNESWGGGIDVSSASLINVTISGNETTGQGSDGGGVFTNGNTTLDNVTISGNATLGDNSSGGGIFARRDGVMIDSIVLGNASVADGGEIGLFGGTTGTAAANLRFVGANIVGADTGAFDARGFANVTNAALSDVFAQVLDGAGVLADNGGPTETILILEGGAAQGTGRGEFGPDTDQRGVARPQGEGRDIGAVELAVTGQAPLLRDDALVLAFDGDGTISVPLSRLLANDEARDGSLAPGGVTVTGADARIEGGALVFSGAAAARLAAGPVAPDGTGGASVTLRYGVTPPPDLAAPSAEVVLRMAAALRLGEATAEADAGGRAVVDLSSLREGGLGEVTISLGPVRATDGGGGGIGAVALSGTDLVFTAGAGSEGRAGAVDVTIVDRLGQVSGATVALEVAEAPGEGGGGGTGGTPDRPGDGGPGTPAPVDDEGRVLLRGTEGRDRIFGTAADERFEGLGARDVLVSGGGDDLMIGGGGPDFFAFARVGAPGTTEVADFGPRDFLVLDDRFFGLGDATIDLRGVTLDQVLIAVRAGLVALDREAGTLSIDPGRDARGEAPELTIALGDGLADLGVSEVFLA